MRLVFFIVLCLIVGRVVSAAPVEACTCAGPATAVEGFKRSVAVFRGKVAAISRPFWDRFGLTNSGSQWVTFEVSKHWKGEPSTNIQVRARLTGKACGFPFKTNQEYLVYVVNEPKNLQTGICTGTKHLNDAGQEMKQLDEWVAGAKN